MATEAVVIFVVVVVVVIVVVVAVCCCVVIVTAGCCCWLVVAAGCWLLLIVYCCWCCCNFCRTCLHCGSPNLYVQTCNFDQCKLPPSTFAKLLVCASPSIDSTPSNHVQKNCNGLQTCNHRWSDTHEIFGLAQLFLKPNRWLYRNFIGNIAACVLPMNNCTDASITTSRTNILPPFLTECKNRADFHTKQVKGKIDCEKLESKWQQKLL